MKRFRTWLPLLLCAGALTDVSLAAAPAAGAHPDPEPRLEVAVWESGRHVLRTWLRGADDARHFVVLVSPDPNFVHPVIRSHALPVGLSGDGALAIPFQMPADLPPNFQFYVQAAYVGPNGIGMTAPRTIVLDPTPVERIDFDWASDGTPVQAGEQLEEQWADTGVHVRVSPPASSPYTRAVAVDTSLGINPGLVTPGYGQGNDEPRELVLALAHEGAGFTEDGFLSAPLADEEGGTISFGFDRPRLVSRISLLDVDRPGSWIRCYDGTRLAVELPVPALGDNNEQTILFPVEKVNRIVVHLSCSAAVSELAWLAAPAQLDLDRTSTGIPLGLEAGELVDLQLQADHGLRVRARSNRSGVAGRALLVEAPADVTGLAEDRKGLAVAADPTDADADGRADAPRVEPLGGVLVLDFDMDVTWTGARVADVDDGETSFFEAFDVAGRRLATIPLAVGADHEIQTVLPNLPDVRQVRLHLGGTGALVGLAYDVAR